MTTSSQTASLLVELFVEELPPKALNKLGNAFAEQLFIQLQAQGLVGSGAVVTPFATPRRLAVHMTQVAAQAPDRAVSIKLMPVSVGLDAQGNATAALMKKLQALSGNVNPSEATVAMLKREGEGKAETLFLDSVVKGATLSEGLQKALEEAVAKLPIPKVMSYQLESGCELPGWSSVQFVRPAHQLIALHADQVCSVGVLGLQSGRQTQGHRFEAKTSPLVIRNADSYHQQLLEEGAVLAGFAERKAEIARQLAEAAAQVGGGCRPIEDDALLDEVTALVERPHVLVCQFEEQFLQVPQECLILTMKANQKYFPLLDASGKLTHRFLVVSNINPEDPSAVIGGNERVVRPRLADAQFFFNQDRKKSLASRVEGLSKVIYHNKLGTQGERVTRVSQLARAIAKALVGQGFDADLPEQADLAAQLAKADLVTDMVGEFPELQGTMGRYYALNDGLPQAVADAIEDHYKPRFAGDDLPRGQVGVVVALADKLETLVGLFGIGNLPTGDKDPFALRRHALGVIRLLTEYNLPLDLLDLLALSTPVFGEKIADGSATQISLADFVFDRLAGSFKEQGYSAQEVDAVLALRPSRLADIPERLRAVRAFAQLPEAQALAAANKRIGNILKKAQEVDAHVSTMLLKEAPEIALHQAMLTVAPEADRLFHAGDYAGSLKTLAALRESVDAFFEGVMVNAEAMDLRLNRHGLLKLLHQAMNRVADLSRLVV